jgi:hypothetical protein
MDFKKTLVLLAVFIAACATPGFAQIYWGNQSPAGVTDDIWCVAYANGTFAAVTNQGNVLTSYDGLAWTSQTVASGTWLVSITYGDGKWVVVGNNGTILVSSDLKSWISAKAVTPNKLNGVAYNGSIFLAVGDNATVITSPDAVNWTVQVVPASLNIKGFLHGITLIADVTDFTATDFLVCGAQAGNGTGSVDVGVMLEVLSDGTVTTTPNLSFSSGRPLATNGNLEAVLYESIAHSAVAVGWNGTVIDDAINSEFIPYIYFNDWNYASTVLPSIVFRGLAFGNGYYVAAGEQGTIVTSTDGNSWTQRFSGDSPSALSTATLLGACFSPTLQRFVITGTGGTILVSNSAPAVFGNVSTRGFVSNTQTFIGGFVIVGTGPRTVLIRADGPVLSAFSVTNPLPDPVLTVYDNNGYVVATNTGWTTNTTPSSISTAALEVGAFALPNPSPDSALLLTLQPGAYTAQITSAKGNSGIALFEAYTD